MNFDEASRKWFSTKNKHFETPGHVPGKVDFEINTDGYESTGYTAILDVTSQCSCGMRVSLEVGSWLFEEVLKELVETE